MRYRLYFVWVGSTAFLHTRPSTLSSILPGIRRVFGVAYEAMAADLERFLKDRPIQARRASVTERLTRWARRNPSLAALGTAMAVLLAVMVVLVANERLRHEHSIVRQNLDEARRARADATFKLWDLYLMQARASRLSGVGGHRFDALETIAAARLPVRQAHHRALRNEAIASLALADVEDHQGLAPALGRGPARAGFPGARGLIARGEADGGVLILDRNGRIERFRLPGLEALAVCVRLSPEGK